MRPRPWQGAGHVLWIRTLWAAGSNGAMTLAANGRFARPAAKVLKVMRGASRFDRLRLNA
ncbi:hypothetical protein PLUA15_230069 [Pseudomonas lundensis]|uniref:Uncharacterized protein n=1 Tax=Pseudomonas lundensis TaxID=86185 RepID=A0AAX2H901_9PSED|nr:hypothetical protein PLUA15_230069 [Pseudomonas lundensis]